MTYRCDICSSEIGEKPDGHFFDQNRVLTSPSFWKYLYTRDSNRLSEESLGGFLGIFCQDSSGYTVCDQCQDMLQGDFDLGKDFEIEGYISSVPSGEVDSHAAGKVAGTVWQKLNGRWPSTIELGGGGATGVLHTKTTTRPLGQRLWRWLIRKWNGIESTNQTLFESIQVNDIVLAEECLEFGADPNTLKCELGLPPLHHATVRGEPDMVHLLLRFNAKLDVRNNEGSAPLHAAAIAGNLDIAKMLVHAGADIEIKNNKDQTPIHFAVIHKYPDIVAWLIEKGANVNSVSANDFTPLLSASLSEAANIGIVDKLLAAGADVNSRAIDKSTVLHFSAFHGDLAAVTRFLLAEADVNARDIDGATPLMTSVRRDYREISSLLISRGADKSIPATENGMEETPAQVATRCGFAAISEILV